MIGIHIVSHGDLCTGIIHSLKMITGETKQIGCTKLLEDSDMNEFREEMLLKSKELDTGQGVLILADMFGATPYNSALFNSREFTEDRYQIITGFNLPMVVEASLNREFMNLTELVESLKNNNGESVVVFESVN